MHARILGALSEVPAAKWDALLDGGNPFVAHAFLAGLESTGCLRPRWGWRPAHAALYEGDALIAAAPAYAKDNSHGEFVFDHAWAHAYQRNDLDYFPKWLGAVPYSPVTGPRLLARDDALRTQLAEAIVALVRDAGWSSAHVNFHPESETAAFDPKWIPRVDVQYHWENRGEWRDFDAFLAAMHGFYLQTFHEYGNTPAVTLDFVRHLARTMPRGLVLFLADHEGETIAGALCLRGGDTLYGRYWGATRQVPGLHFETCYYQGIDYCLREGLRRFEPGAQGEHKIARGFLPTLVHSRHWIAHPDFEEAIRAWCAEESASVRRYMDALAAHSPFRAGVA